MNDNQPQMITIEEAQDLVNALSSQRNDFANKLAESEAARCRSERNLQKALQDNSSLKDHIQKSTEASSGTPVPNGVQSPDETIVSQNTSVGETDQVSGE